MILQILKIQYFYRQPIMVFHFGKQKNGLHNLFFISADYFNNCSFSIKLKH